MGGAVRSFDQLIRIQCSPSNGDGEEKQMARYSDGQESEGVQGNQFDAKTKETPDCGPLN